MAGQIVKHVQPVTPRCSAGGPVVMRAIIGKDGKIEHLSLVSAPSNPPYINAVVTAVRQWEFKPYLLHGNPVRVDTTITLNPPLNREKDCDSSGRP